MQSSKMSRSGTNRTCLAPPAPKFHLAQRHHVSVVQRLAPACSTFSDAQMTPIAGNTDQFPAAPGVYAVYNKLGFLQYIGLSRKLSASIGTHVQELADLTHSVKSMKLDNPTRDGLTSAWKEWVEEAVAETGTIPPGNAPGETMWQHRAPKPAKPEIRLTGGKGITGVTMEQLLEQVVKGNRVVAFVKGTRREPQCGFSHKLMTMLNESKADYEVVNVLDELHNPDLRNVIKAYSQWPTLPQLYVDGEFVGGTDIVEQMAASGELGKVLKGSCEIAS